ncbi:DNA topoisomerase-1 [Halovenus aranensis]|uniref:DNA topoisomerase-1 n=1 Tax=Halovenus aranensis TaxID=890420 RepID=A0A1G8VPW0_9EURY|nr:DNA topoisomerase-1 [Halovenus aranensis]
MAEPIQGIAGRCTTVFEESQHEEFNGVWNCPNCDGSLRVLRRGGLLLGCENYPACETGFSLPAGR